MATPKDYQGQTPAWCPGCGNFPILKVYQEVLAGLGIEPHRLTIVSGIGQGAKTPHYMKCNTFNGLHGRTLPVATGIRLANHEMMVLAVAGDGDCYGEGGNHLLHAMRRNIGVKLFVHNNQIYGLTKGQGSPTTAEGTVTRTQPFGIFSEQLNPIALAVAMDCSFVARGFAGDPDLLKNILKQAIGNRGFSLVDILQPCVTFNKVNTYEWYRQRVYRLGPDHDPKLRDAAFRAAQEWGERIPTGIIYRSDRPSFEERVPVLREQPLVRQPLVKGSVQKTLKEFY